MLSSRRWSTGGALLLVGACIAVGCAKAGPGDAPFGLGPDGGVFGTVDDSGGAIEASPAANAGGSSASGLNTPSGSGDDDSGGGGDDVAPPANCDPTTCEGCCSNGACVAGTADNACGKGVGDCTDCTMTSEVCSFGSCVAGNQPSSSSGGSASGSSGGAATPPMRQMAPMPSTSCGGQTCTNACFPLGLPCCTSAGACGCIALYFLPCQ